MPRNYASLADQSVFPSISDLPGDYTCPETGGGVFGCLLVEIVSIERITRLVLRTFDRADSPVTVAFYTGDRGRSIENDPKLKPGNTMAILFPRRHLFLDGTVGVRQEHYGYFKFFPGNMKVLFQLSDEMRCWPARFATHKKCHGCGKKDKPLLRCAKCGVVTYCDKVSSIRIFFIWSLNLTVNPATCGATQGAMPTADKREGLPPPDRG
ncbi:hypothetical protein ASPFODRAFT_191306 [Aspergillus luchuensis CBS 106.47]|uniref:MYND-type zinc finger protein samB n=1 Tax=Aspergillus luchuensis (strain CBS 106.47) TaxID=1137211 RepID=A0A1M3TEW1_ASPLC|nr:hypothetical protein ASPFODRAFT_191306 [Aspergillus luchuensis CBS 106.47]